MGKYTGLEISQRDIDFTRSVLHKITQNYNSVFYDDMVSDAYLGLLEAKLKYPLFQHSLWSLIIRRRIIDGIRIRTHHRNHYQRDRIYFESIQKEIEHDANFDIREPYDYIKRQEAAMDANILLDKLRQLFVNHRPGYVETLLKSKQGIDGEWVDQTDAELAEWLGVSPARIVQMRARGREILRKAGLLPEGYWVS